MAQTITGTLIRKHTEDNPTGLLTTFELAVSWTKRIGMAGPLTTTCRFTCMGEIAKTVENYCKLGSLLMVTKHTADPWFGRLAKEIIFCGPEKVRVPERKEEMSTLRCPSCHSYNASEWREGVVILPAKEQVLEAYNGLPAKTTTLSNMYFCTNCKTVFKWEKVLSHKKALDYLYATAKSCQDSHFTYYKRSLRKALEKARKSLDQEE